jgi:hypothetical protein
MQIGCNAFVAKPVQGEDLFNKVKDVLNLEWIEAEPKQEERTTTTGTKPIVFPDAAVVEELKS